MTSWYAYVASGKRKSHKHPDKLVKVRAAGATNTPERRIKQHRGQLTGGAQVFAACTDVKFDFIIASTGMTKAKALRLESCLAARQERNKLECLLDVLMAEEFSNLPDVHVYLPAAKCGRLHEELLHCGKAGRLDVWRRTAHVTYGGQVLDSLTWQAKRKPPAPPDMHAECLKSVRKLRRMFPNIKTKKLCSMVAELVSTEDFRQQL